MKTVAYIFSLIVLLSSIGLKAEETRLLEYSGSVIESPYWFKDSFLELTDDIEEAKEEGKKLILYFHQAGCPYCYNLVQQSLLDPILGQYIQENFDLIALNLWGDREVTLPDGSVLSEKELAIKWKVQYTPTLVFYTDSDEPFLRIDGYRSKEMLAKILDYVVSGDAETSLAQSLINKEIDGELYPSVSFQSSNNLSGLEEGKPLAVLFEYPGCEDCN
ncbi:thioredoxin fold domain-containing protein, partial [Neptuniibacter sp.]|uniref:thioredoxin family protein n=1 Tax=Neptuniibacter sp. TaxID=1962643 RepID=UPI002631AB7D